MCKLTYYTGSINWILREYEEGYYNLHELQEEIEYHLESTKGDTDISPQEHLILNCFRRMLKAIIEKESDKL